jgi:hypothetical protein
MQLATSRRSFLQQAGAVAAFAATTCDAVRNIARAETASGEAYWELVRRQFIFPETAVPMNSANLCPSFQAVAEKVTTLTRVIDYDVSFNNRAQFNETLKASRAKVYPPTPPSAAPWTRSRRSCGRPPSSRAGSSPRSGQCCSSDPQ